jgi:hypothetical protein
MYLLDTKSFVSSFGLVIDQYCFYQFYERVILKQIFSNIFLRSFTYLSKFIDWDDIIHYYFRSQPKSLLIDSIIDISTFFA